MALTAWQACRAGQPDAKVKPIRITGTLQRDDPPDPKLKHPCKVHEVDLAAGKAVVIRLMSKDFDGYLIVRDSQKGPLNGLPLAALPGNKAGGYLLEEYTFAAIPTPQLLPDLVAKTDPRFERPVSMLLVGDVDFGAGEDFKRLARTGVEINDIRVKFQDRFTDGTLKVLRKAEATKQAFAAAAPQQRYLHLATHGSFADPSVPSALDLKSRERVLRTALTFDRQVVGEHPGLLSGIVFAGANAQDKKKDAILTALEAGELELRGVELVVLSACDTGLGRVAGGEGVLGLQRAVQVAGARTTVTSLWKVDDTATQRLMSRFYENLWEKKLSKVEALREAQLWMLREGGTRGLDLPPDTKSLPPQYWAAFVLSGDWR
jgi:CHAT domain-containing protein